VVARLKVLAELLTYRTDVPQEGRIRGGPGDVEMRVSTFPTLFGEKAVVRLFAGPGRFLRPEDLGLPPEIRATLGRLLGETSGAILLAGPAGSGKTTTIYACLRELVAASAGTRSLATLEDPIEVAVPGVAQAQVNPAAGFDLGAGLRSLLRQDPEVIAVGEIRDRATAEVAFQAALTGHLVLSTFHAGSAAGVVGRLSDMGIEPYVLRSGVRAIICQRLVRTLCGLRPRGARPGPMARTARGERPGRRRLRRLPRHRLPRPHRPGRAAGPRGHRARPRDPVPPRRRPTGGAGRRRRHGHPLAEGPSRRRGRPDLPGRDPPRARRLGSPASTNRTEAPTRRAGNASSPNGSRDCPLDTLRQLS
jgi:hypothetical protein